MSKQPRDDANAPIPVLSYRPQSGQVLTFEPGSAVRSEQFSGSVRVVSIFSTATCFMELGDDSVTANASTSHFIPAQTYMDISLGSSIDARFTHKYISIFSPDNEGIFYISERE